VAYLGGVLSSLTPCIYPMIPITLSIAGGVEIHSGGHLGKRTRAGSLFMGGAAYVAGMSIVYAFLGVAAGLTGRVFGSFTNTSGWYLFIGIVMTLSALMMLDVIPFDPQAWLAARRRRQSNADAAAAVNEQRHETQTLTGIFLVGATSGFIAAPCTTPVLTAILAFIAKSQSVGLGLILMIAYALGLGTLLLALAAFTQALKHIPKSGVWMQRIKILSGLLLLAFANSLIFLAGKYS
jgi:thiol:disulfide interchange protein DsbD